MKKKIYLCVFLLVALFFVGKSALAVDDPVAKKIKEAFEGNKINPSAMMGTSLEELIKTGGESAKGKVEVIADVNIRNAEISEVKKGQLKLVFDVENSMDLQSKLIYGLELVKDQGAGKSILSDVKIFSADRITVEKGGSVHREIEYRAPEYLAGNYALWLKIKDESGLLLALQPFKVNLGGSGKFVEQGNPCYLTIEGEKDIKYSLAQGADLKKEEKLFLNCQTKNLTGEDVSVLPAIEFFQRDYYGQKTGEYQADASAVIVFAKDEEKLTKIAIPLPENPQAYDAKIVLKKEGKNISNPVIAHLVVSGKSGTVINASLDKNQYAAGENAQLTLLWAGPADTFLGARTGGSFLQEPKFEVEFRDGAGVDCSEKKIYAVGDFKTSIDILLERDCQYPHVTVKLIDEGQLLYEKNITAEPEKKEIVLDKKITQNSRLPMLTILALSLILFLAIVFLVHRKNKTNKNIIKIGIFLFIAGTSFSVVSPSRAATATLYGDPGWITGLKAYAWGANLVWPTACGLDPSWVPQCPWNYWSTPYCKFSDRVFWYADWWSIIGCYQDIVSFSYGLSSTSVNQGATITASGTATMANVCNNAVTAGMAVSPKNDSELNWVINSVCSSVDGATYGGSYSFNTAGWGCGYYNSTFYYAFNHGCTSNVAATYTKIGTGYIGYSVNNCCSQTCATGPGCRFSLVNGIVASGTCCGGTSCVQCKPNYYWNGSMCVADCSTWGLSLSASPNSGSAPLSSRLTSSISSIFGGESYSYSGHSCGSGGPAPTNISGGSFTCNYSSAGTYYPSVTAVAQTTGCVRSASSTVSVSAPIPNPTATLSASPTSIPYGGSSTLTWTTSNATSCWLDYFGWVSNTGGSVSTGALTTSRTFNLTCYNGAGSPTLTQSVSVTVIFSCTGSDPANADLCPGDDAGLSAQTAKSIVSSCGAPKCEYVCKSTHIFDAGSCRLKVAGQCGSAKGKSFCGAPTADLCSPGTPSPNLPTLSSNKWSWYCTNDGLISSECTARKECSWMETIN